jgi:cytochrome P450
MNDNRSKDLTLDRTDSLIYLDCVINEVFRFCTPLSGTVRMVYRDDRLSKTGAQLFKGTQVFIQFYNLARDSRLWSIDPDIFYPERFLNEDKDHHSHALIPLEVVIVNVLVKILLDLN